MREKKCLPRELAFVSTRQVQVSEQIFPISQYAFFISRFTCWVALLQQLRRPKLGVARKVGTITHIKTKYYKTNYKLTSDIPLVAAINFPLKNIF